MRPTAISIALVLSLATISSAAVLYQTGFESPPFSAGNLDTQDGWIADGGGSTGSVQGGLVKSGSQAVQLNAAGRSTTAWWFKELLFPIPLATAPVIRVDWDMRIAMIGTATPWGVDVYNLDPGPAGIKRVAAMLVNALGVVSVWDGTAGAFVSTGRPAALDAWHHFRIDINYSTNTANYYFNHDSIAENVPISVPVDLTLADADFYNIDNAGGSDRAYYDNFSVLSVPNCDLVGDLDLSTRVNGLDIQKFVDCLFGEVSENCACADVNGDGVEDANDVPGMVGACLLAP